MRMRLFEWWLLFAALFGVLLFGVWQFTESDMGRHYDGKIVRAFNESSTTLLVYYGGPGDDDIVIECTNGSWRLSRYAGRKFWVIEMPVAWNACEVSHDIFTWPTFTVNPNLRRSEGDSNE